MGCDQSRPPPPPKPEKEDIQEDFPDFDNIDHYIKCQLDSAAKPEQETVAEYESPSLKEESFVESNEIPEEENYAENEPKPPSSYSEPVYCEETGFQKALQMFDEDDRRLDKAEEAVQKLQKQTLETDPEYQEKVAREEEMWSRYEELRNMESELVSIQGENNKWHTQLLCLQKVSRREAFCIFGSKKSVRKALEGDMDFEDHVEIIRHIESYTDDTDRNKRMFSIITKHGVIYKIKFKKGMPNDEMFRWVENFNKFKNFYDTYGGTF